MEVNCLTVREVAERLRVSLTTVYQLCTSRQLPHVRVGPKRGAIRIREKDLRDFLESCQARQPGLSASPTQPHVPADDPGHIR
jgi:excisionase family DNA binding protein